MATETQETIVDIIAEKRRLSEQIRNNLSTVPVRQWEQQAEIKSLEEEADRLEAAYKREKAAIEADALAVGGFVAATAEKSSVVDTKFELCNYPEQVLKIGRDFQDKDGFRGAHYDTVKLLCDTIEYQQEQLKTKTEVGDAAKLREALEFCVKGMCGFCRMDAEARGMTTECVNGCEALRKAKVALNAPPRNCDKYANHNYAMKAFDAFVREQGKLGFINPYTEAFKWLFAHATEGGAK